MTGLTRIPAPSKSTISGQSAADRFTFVGARKTRTSAGIRITVLARKGSNLVSFQTPLEPIDSSKNSGSRSDGTYNASESLSDKIAQFSAGDIVALKYNNRGFQFVLSDINPYLMTATGTLTHTTEKIIRRTAHTTAYLRTGKIKIMLVVPQTNRTGGADAATLTSTLKSLGKQEATFTYYKHKGLMWIAQITPR
jgi:hypothetical protein